MSIINLYLDTKLNPLIIRAFLCGIYFLLFVQAVWKLLQKRAHVPYIIALFLLWISISSTFIINWVASRRAFVVYNNSPVSILDQLDDFPLFIEFTPTFVATVVSDSILIWRCYVLWHATWSLIILIPLLLASSAFNLYVVVDQFSDVAILSLGLNQLISAATIACATTMIALKIILVTRKSYGQYSYAKVIEILVQSAALQSLFMIVNAFCNIAMYALFESNSNNVTLVNLILQIGAYAATCRIVVMGIAPTLIAFRVAEEKPRSEVNGASPTTSLSRLRFRRSAHRMDRESEAQRADISTIRLDLAQRNDPVASVHFGGSSNNGISAPGGNENFEGKTEIIRPVSVWVE